MSKPDDEIGKDIADPEGVDSNEQSDSEADGVIPAEILEGLPADDRKRITTLLRSSVQIGAMGNPLHGKVTSNHISQVLDSADKERDLTFRDRQRTRWFVLAASILLMVFFGFLLVYLVDRDTALFMNIFVAIASFVGGAGFGYGIKK